MKRIPLILLLHLLLVGPIQAEENRSPNHLPGGLLAATYLGGSGTDGGWPQNAMLLDTTGNLYVVGYTASEDFPTTPDAFSQSRKGHYDTFIAKFDPSLSTLLAATYLGGSSSDQAVCLALDHQGCVYVAGDTTSTDFPVTAGAFQTTHTGVRDFFVAKLDSQLTTLLHATYLGGSEIEERLLSLLVDETGEVYLTGLSRSDDYPTTTGAYNETINEASAPYLGDMVISRLSSDLSVLRASTYLGGAGFENQSRITLAGSHALYVLGTTDSLDFPTTPGAYCRVNQGVLDISVSRMDRHLTTLHASTLLGGADWDYGYGLIVESSTGNVFFTGHGSFDFPTTPGAFDRTYHGGPNASSDIIVAKMDSALTQLLASTFLGGDDFENGVSIELDSQGEVCVGGYTRSGDFPTTPGAFDAGPNGNFDAFVSLFSNDLGALRRSSVLGGGAKDREAQAILSGDGVAYLSVNMISQDPPMTAFAYEDTYQGATDVYLAKIILTSLIVDYPFIPAETGGTVSFTLDARASNTHREYLLLGSMSGASPGYPLPGGLATLPLNWDGFTDRLFFWMLQPALMNFHGFLDDDGQGTARMVLGPLRPKAVGLRLYFSYCLGDPFDFVSNPVVVEII